MKKCDSSVKFFLIVDDLEHQRIAMETAIRQAVPRSEFLKVATFSEAKDVIEKTTDTIHVAVIDLKLEGSDEEGVELIKMLKRSPRRREMRTILITAYPDDKNRALAKKAGADVYISKLNQSVTKELQEAVQQLDC